MLRLQTTLEARAVVHLTFLDVTTSLYSLQYRYLYTRPVYLYTAYNTATCVRYVAAEDEDSGELGTDQ